MTTFLHILLLLVDIVALAWIFDRLLRYFYCSSVVDNIIGKIIFYVVLPVAINIFIFIHGFYDLFIFFGLFMFIDNMLSCRIGNHPLLKSIVRLIVGSILCLINLSLYDIGILSELSTTVSFSGFFWFAIFCSYVVTWVIHLFLYFFMASTAKEGIIAAFKRDETKTENTVANVIIIIFELLFLAFLIFGLLDSILTA